MDTNNKSYSYKLVEPAMYRLSIVHWWWVKLSEIATVLDMTPAKVWEKYIHLSIYAKTKKMNVAWFDNQEEIGLYQTWMYEKSLNDLSTEELATVLVPAGWWNAIKVSLREPTRTLPKEMEEYTIAKMVDGDIGYVYPWALFADSKRRLFVIGTYPVDTQTSGFGTQTLKIKKCGEMILVEKSSVKNKYSLLKDASTVFVGVTKKDYIQVQLVKSF